MKHKREQKPTIRLVKQPVRISMTDPMVCHDILDFVASHGYLLYEDPTNEEFIIISPEKLTLGWFKSKAKIFHIDLKWWKKETDYDDHLEDELSEFFW